VMPVAGAQQGQPGELGSVRRQSTPRSPAGHLFVLHLRDWMQPSAKSMALAALHVSAPRASVRTEAEARDDLGPPP